MAEVRHTRTRGASRGKSAPGWTTLLLALAAMLAAVPQTTAQMAVDPTVGTLVSTFTQACLAHAGDTAALRAWADKAGLRPLAPGLAAQFLEGDQGVAWSATIGSDRRVLVSPNDSSCRLLVRTGSALATQEVLLAALARDGVKVESGRAQTTPDGLSTLRRYHAATGTRGWHLTLRSTVRIDDPDGPPSLELTARTAPP